MAHSTGLILALVLGSAAMMAQEPAAPETQPLGSPTVQAAGPEATISPVQLGKRILRDQKDIWTFPVRAVQGRHWLPVLVVAIGAVGLVALDPYTEPYFHDQSRFNGYETGILRGRNTALAEMLTPVAFYVTGLATHSSYAKNTGILTAEAIADSQIVSFVLKQATGRLKPSDIPTNGNYRNTWFKYKGSLSNGGGFPSGHTATAFAVATVLSERYREHRWVHWVAYGAATFISVSRLPDQAHFASDIFIGGAIGYSIGHFVVLKPHASAR